MVAEATRDSVLGPVAGGQPDLLFTGKTIPRKESLCGQALAPTEDAPTMLRVEADSETKLPVSVILDLAEDGRHQGRSSAEGVSSYRFYTGVPIRSPEGIDIGVFSIFDDQPRQSIEKRHVRAMWEVSATLSHYIESMGAIHIYRRSDRMARGISSFVEKEPTISRWWMDSDDRPTEDPMVEGGLNEQQQNPQATQQSLATSGLARRPNPSPLQGAVLTPSSNETSTARVSPLRNVSLSKNSSNSLHAGGQKVSADEVRSQACKCMFSKAANVIREAVEVDGVLCLDASIGSFGGLVTVSGRHPNTEGTNSPETASSGGDSDGSVSSTEGPYSNHCGLLGFSTSDSSSIDGAAADPTHLSVPKRFLKRLIQRFPQGKIFMLEEDGSITSVRFAFRPIRVRN